jgi:hypothetical protein
MEKTAKYLCTLKLIDETVCGNSKDKSAPEYLTATMFARTADELPPITKVGTILRIHRAQTKKHKDIMQLNCDVNIKASWIIFDPVDGQSPIAKKGKQFTFTPLDKIRLKSIRKFLKEHFDKTELEGITLKEAEKKKPKDFDSLCYVLDVKTKAKAERIKLCDGTKIVKMDLPITRKGVVVPLEVVRVRGVDFDPKKKFKYLTLSEYSSVLRVPGDFASAKALLKEINGPKLPEDIKSELALYTPLKGDATKLLGSHKGAKLMKLKELCSGKSLGSAKYFKVNVNVVEVGPKDPLDWICVVEKKTGKQ